jgi:hypothetical protein
MIMIHKSFIRGALTFLVAIALTFAALAMNPAMADEGRDKAVRKALVERTDTFCKAILPVWFASERGIATPELRTLLADCFLGQARLALLGVESGLALKDTGLAELPAVLLRMETGMNLDIYRPLAGRAIRVRSTER